MSKNGPDPQVDSHFYDHTRGKSDRAVAIEAIVLLDMHLIQLLQAFMVRDSDEVNALLGEDHPLGSFSARIRAAYCLGLISLEERDDLWTLKNIWEYFIHQMEDLSLAHDPLREWCKSFKLPIRIQYAGETRTPRAAFVFTIALLIHQLTIRIQQAEEKRRAIPSEFSMFEQVESIK